MVQNKSMKKTSPIKEISYFPLLISLAVIAIIALGYFFGLKPLEKRLALEYLNRGDDHLISQHYLDAVVDYKKSLLLDNKVQAENKIALIDKVQNNYLEIKPFLAGKNNTALLESLAKANAVPQNQSAGIDTIESYIGNNQPYLAETMAQTLVEMNSGDNNAWLWLGIARLQTARTVQMTADGRKAKLASAHEAVKKANELDKSNALAIKYLAEINKML